MRKTLLLVLICCCLYVSGCSTRGAISTNNNSIKISQTATFSNTIVIDESGYIWDDSDKDKIDIALTLKHEIDSVLSKAHLVGEDYILKTTGRRPCRPCRNSHRSWPRIRNPGGGSGAGTPEQEPQDGHWRH